MKKKHHTYKNNLTLKKEKRKAREQSDFSQDKTEWADEKSATPMDSLHYFLSEARQIKKR